MIPKQISKKKTTPAAKPNPDFWRSINDNPNQNLWRVNYFSMKMNMMKLSDCHVHVDITMICQGNMQDRFGIVQ